MKYAFARSVVTAIAVLTSATLLLLQGQTPPNATLEGQVLEIGTGRPVEGAQIRVTPMTPPGDGSSGVLPAVLTDREGHFVVKDVAPESYRAVADKAGYAPQVYGASQPGMHGFVGLNDPEVLASVASIIRLEAGRALRNVVFHLTPAAGVSGRILAASGEPVVGVQVELLPAGYDAMGRKIGMSLAKVGTNDRGDYRLFNVEPGRYYLSALVSPAIVVQQGTSGESGFSANTAGNLQKYIQTYFPGVDDLTRATLIEIRPRDNRTGMDITMAPWPRSAYAIRGRIVDGATGKPPSVQSILSAGVVLIPRNATHLNSFTAVPPHLQPDGTFELLNVVPGSYWLTTRAMVPTPPPLPGEPRPKISMSVASIPVDIAAQDIEGLLVTLVPPMTIRGKLTGDGPVPPFGQMRVQLNTVRVGALAMNMMPTPAPVTPAANGDLVFDDLNVGEYELVFSGLPSDIFIKEARFGGDDVLGRRFTITGPAPVEILVSAKGGRVTGVLKDRDGMPLPNTQVVLVPQGRSTRIDLFKVARTNVDGRFNLRGVAPGDYALFAWEDLPRFGYFDPEFMRDSAAFGKNLHIEEGAESATDIEIIPSRRPPKE